MYLNGLNIGGKISVGA